MGGCQDEDDVQKGMMAERTLVRSLGELQLALGVEKCSSMQVQGLQFREKQRF